MKRPAAIYRGERHVGPTGQILGIHVARDGRTLTPDRSARLTRNAEGLEWGYRGAGPSQLALALILDATDTPMLALRAHHWFANYVVSQWAFDTWEITAGEIVERVMRFEAEERAALGQEPHLVEGGGI